jgi:hypothetical protein
MAGELHQVDYDSKDPSASQWNKVNFSFRRIFGMIDELKNGSINRGKLDHSSLSNLSYPASGHTGFSPTIHTHSELQLRSEKDMANGYVGLDSGILVPASLLGTGTPSTSKFLRGDRTWQTLSLNSMPFTPADNPSASPDTMDDEFNNSTLDAKWTNNSLGSAYDINTTWPGWIQIRGKDIAVDKVDLMQTFDPGTGDFSFTAKVGGRPRSGAQSVWLMIGKSSTNDWAMINWQYNSSDSTMRLTFSKCVAGTWTYWITTKTVTDIAQWGGIWYLHLQRIGGTFDAMYSGYGIDWSTLSSNYAISAISGAACVNARLQILPDGLGSSLYTRLGVDWFRHNWRIIDR